MDKILYGYIGLSILLGALAIAARSNTIILTVIITFLVLLVISLVLSVTKSASYIRNALSEIVRGQLNINIRKSRIKLINLIAEKLNEYLSKIRNLVCQYQNFSEKTIKESGSIKIQAENLRSSSSEIASTTQNIAEAANSQAESTARMKDNMEAFAKGIEEICENAQTSFGVASNSRTIVEESFKTFSETFQKVEEIKDYNDKVLVDMLTLDKAIRKISDITETVEAIASQTRLLALNASIEAARAGDAGRGFAVVAEEVNKLADDSSSSAKKIKELVEDTIGNISSLTTNIQGQTEIIGNNVVFAKNALEKSKDINSAVDKNMEATEAIVQLTKKQMEKLGTITHAIELINESTQQNAAISEEINASTEEQLSIIETMYNSIIYLNNAIEYSNSIIDDFVGGFRITDEIKDKVEKTKKLVSEITSSPEILKLHGEELRKYLISKQNSVKFVELISYITKAGYQEITTEDVPEEHRDVSARPYFLKAISGETFISKEYISTFSNHYNITIVMPIHKNSKIEGVILADINLNED